MPSSKSRIHPHVEGYPALTATEKKNSRQRDLNDLLHHRHPLFVGATIKELPRYRGLSAVLQRQEEHGKERRCRQHVGVGGDRRRRASHAPHEGDGIKSERGGDLRRCPDRAGGDGAMTDGRESRNELDRPMLGDAGKCGYGRVAAE